MTHDLKPYSAYKDSGLPWLGKIPVHWEVGTLRHVAAVRLSGVDKHSIEGETSVRLCNYTDVYNRDFITADIRFMHATASKSEITAFTLQESDILITKDSEEWDDIAVPALVTQDLDGVLCGYHLALIRPDQTQIDGGYLLRAFVVPALSWQFNVAANGVTRYGLSKHAIKAATFPLPLLNEQRKIVQFLNTVDRRIRHYIRSRQRLIDLLIEQKQAIIQRAVTRGLDPTVRLKPSGVEWLGEVPEHWEVGMVKQHYRVELGKMLNSKTEEKGAARFPYLNASNIHWNRIHLARVNEMAFSPSQLERYRLKRGDLLVTEGGVTVGRSAIWNDELPECYYQNSLNRARSILSLSTKFLYYWMYFVTESGFVDAIANKATFGHLTNVKLNRLPLLAPPPAEADSITRYLDGRLSEFSVIDQQLNTEIALVCEYRTRLIADVVTGKVDVRGVALPEGEGEGEALEEIEETEPEGVAEMEEEGDDAEE